MSNIRVAFFIIILIFSGCVRSNNALQAPVARELTLRNGIPNFIHQLKHSADTVRVAFIGGSITEAAQGWREQTVAYLQQEYPKAIVSHINAAIGGTGSDLGAFRLQKHVLVHNPHLIFVEFAVNDVDKPAETTIRSMEGIVRKIRKHNPNTDICFVYTLKEDMYEPLSKGAYPAVVTTMEKVAGYYKIPSIHMGLEIVKLKTEGKLIFSGKKEEHPDKILFSGDGVHPYPETGHYYYTEAVKRSFEKLKKIEKSVEHPLPQPINADNWENAQMVSLKAVKFEGDWEKVSPANVEPIEKFSHLFDTVYTASKAGASFTISFIGRRIGIQDIIGPTSGQYSVRIDQQNDFLLPRFDAYCFFYRSHYFLLDELPDGKHSVTFTLAPEKLDKAAILAQLDIKMDDKHDYDVQEVFVGNVLLLGEIIEER